MQQNQNLKRKLEASSSFQNSIWMSNFNKHKKSLKISSDFKTTVEEQLNIGFSFKSREFLDSQNCPNSNLKWGDLDFPMYGIKQKIESILNPKKKGNGKYDKYENRVSELNFTFGFKTQNNNLGVFENQNPNWSCTEECNLSSNSQFKCPTLSFNSNSIANLKFSNLIDNLKTKKSVSLFEMVTVASDSFRKDEGLFGKSDTGLFRKDEGLFGKSDTELFRKDEGLFGKSDTELFRKDEGLFRKSDTELRRKDEGFFGKSGTELFRKDEGLFGKSDTELFRKHEGLFGKIDTELFRKEEGLFGKTDTELLRKGEGVFGKSDTLVLDSPLVSASIGGLSSSGAKKVMKIRSSTISNSIATLCNSKPLSKDKQIIKSPHSNIMPTQSKTFTLGSNESQISPPNSNSIFKPKDSILSREANNNTWLKRFRQNNHNNNINNNISDNNNTLVPKLKRYKLDNDNNNNNYNNNNNNNNNKNNNNNSVSEQSVKTWIQRWTVSKKSPSGKNEINENLLNKDEDLIQGKDLFPSIHALAMMGKAMNKFRPCEFQRKGQSVVWNSNEF